MRKLTTKEFIEKAIKIHDNKFNYSLIEYEHSKIKVNILCNNCNKVFEQTPYRHLLGNGCNYCSRTKLLTQKEIIEKSIEIHGNKYNYDNIVYINNKTNLNILCNNCNKVFEQNSNNHINKKCGCPNCYINNITTESFIEKSIEIHRDLYNYNLVNYINTKTKIDIICNKCNNIFKQLPNNHLHLKGCPICNNSKGEIIIYNFLKDNYIEFKKQYKFSDCKYKKVLPFDFYLPLHNICIEYDGIQHYQPVNIFGGQDRYLLQIIRDEIKNVYCNKNNIKLIRIKYNENILDILNNLKIN